MNWKFTFKIVIHAKIEITTVYRHLLLTKMKTNTLTKCDIVEDMVTEKGGTFSDSCIVDAMKIDEIGVCLTIFMGY
jgi:hypothetical protein